MSYSYEYPRPAVTVDCVLFGYSPSLGLSVLLIERGEEPFKGSWALPGGFVQMEESTEEAARRELEEETSLQCNFLEQVYTFSYIGRDPRGRTISVAYSALLPREDNIVEAATDARDAKWFKMSELPELAFDHLEILDVAYKRLCGKITYEPVGFGLLPKQFTLSELQRLYEELRQVTLDKRNFRKKVLSMNLLVDTEFEQEGVAHRSARLYEFDEARYSQLKEEGFEFRLG